MKAYTLAVAVAAVALLVLALPASAAERLHADLDGYQVAPLFSTPGTGQFRGKISGDQSFVTFELTYQNLIGNEVSEVALHFAREGASGGILVQLCGPVTQACMASPITGSFNGEDMIDLSGQGIAAGEFDEMLRAMRAGAVYVLVRTNVRSMGEIRGQIKAASVHSN